jgi:hypothetical protein
VLLITRLAERELSHESVRLCQKSLNLAKLRRFFRTQAKVVFQSVLSC